jgi:hypothetical protein
MSSLFIGIFCSNEFQVYLIHAFILGAIRPPQAYKRQRDD